MMLETGPFPHETRWMVWTDSRVGRSYAHDPRSYARWFWAASGPRGHMSGAEGTADDAEQRAYAAAHSLMGHHELHPPKAKGAE